MNEAAMMNNVIWDSLKSWATFHYQGGDFGGGGGVGVFCGSFQPNIRATTPASLCIRRSQSHDYSMWRLKSSSWL